MSAYTDADLAQAKNDLACNHRLIGDLAAKISRTAAEARKYSPRWAQIDSELRAVLGAAGTHKSNNPPLALCILRAGQERFDQIAAEETIARKRENDARIAASLKVVTDRHREAARAEFAKRISKDTRAAIDRLRERLDAANIRLGGIENDADFRGVLHDLADAARSLTTSIDIEMKASIDRNKEAA